MTWGADHTEMTAGQKKYRSLGNLIDLQESMGYREEKKTKVKTLGNAHCVGR
jgi:hypothetical protein